MSNVEWLDIATAPRDGSDVLVHRPGERSGIAWWDSDKYAKRPRPMWVDDRSHMGRTWCRDHPPTHPLAPATATAGEQAMSDRETLLSLAARCEAAVGADRGLDAEVGRVVDAAPKRRNIWRRNRYPLQLIRVAEYWLPYTASLDAAESLVPSGWSWHAVKQGRRGTGWASVTDPGQEGLPACKAATPALALCAAALRARAEGVE